MTAPEPQPLPHMEIGLGFDVNDPSGIPLALVKFQTGACEFTWKIDARKAGSFAQQLAEGIANVAAAAMAHAKPQIVTPSSGLLLPANHTNGRKP